MSHIDEGVLEAYLDGETEEEERREVERHLETCIECRERLVEVTTLSRSVSALLAELEPGPVQPPPWRELEERAAERLSAPPPRSRLRPVLAWAAGLFLAFSIGWWSGGVWRSPLYMASEVAGPAEPSVASLDQAEKKEGDGESNSGEGSAGTDDLRIDSNKSTGTIQQGTSGVPGIDGGIGLNDALDRSISD